MSRRRASYERCVKEADGIAMNDMSASNYDEEDTRALQKRLAQLESK